MAAVIAAGLRPQVIQARRVTRRSSKTMDAHGHLFPDDDDATRKALDELLAKPAGDAAGKQ